MSARALSIVHTEASLGWGGQEIRILNEALGMAARGHKILIAAPAAARIYTEARALGLAATAMPIGRKNGAGLRAMRRLLKTERFDVVNSHSSTDSWLAALARIGLANAPALVRTRHISAPVSRNWATRWLYACATDRMATTGETLRHDLIEALHLDPQRVVSVPTGMNIDRFRPGDRAAARLNTCLPQDLILVGIVATLRSWKGHRLLIDAIASLGRSDIGLVIVGDGPQRDALTATAAERSLANVWMPGNQADVVPWLNSLDIVALPSYANEGVPQALVQAMLCERACITTTVGAIGEAAIDGQTALIVAPQNVDQLAAAIGRLADSAELRHTLGEAARKHCVDRFDATVMIDRMEKLFFAAVGESQ